jgi:hypothetical protein
LIQQLETVQGLIPTLLQLIAPSSTATYVIRLAASIYLKNRITTSWRILPPPVEVAPNAIPSDDLIPVIESAKKSVHSPIPLSDRQSLKTNILPLIAALSNAETSAASANAANGSSKSNAESNQPIKLQMAMILGKMLDVDFPNDWPGVVDEMSTLIRGNEGEVEAGLRATVEIMRGFRYVVIFRWCEIRALIKLCAPI